MEALVDILPVVLAAATLAAAVSAALTRTRAQAWAVTAGLLWLGTASLTASALLGSPFALVVVGASLTVAALFAAARALLGPTKRGPLEIRHALNAR